MVRTSGRFIAALALLSCAATAMGEIKRMVSTIDGVQSGTGSPGRGCALLTVDTDANTVEYRIAFSGLNGNETAAHFHGPAGPGANAGVVFGLGVGNPKVGVWNYLEAQEPMILDGLVYINIHSSTNPGGEIRGQVADLVATIDGGQENPPVASPSNGFGVFQIDTGANTLDYHIAYTPLGAAETAAHIHGSALHTLNAGVVHALPAGSPKIGTWNYPEAMEADILNGLMYVNIHSAANPGGEVRGQITPIVTPIDGDQEVPPTGSGGAGCGYFSIRKDIDDLGYYIRIGNLDGNETAAHIHGFAPPGQNAGVLHGLPAGSPKRGIWNFAPNQQQMIQDGLTYVNIHSTVDPGGEIRGQIIFPAKPIPPKIVHNGFTGDTRPPTSYIDPRGESSNGVDLDLGLQSATVRFTDDMVSCAGGPLTTANVVLSETGGAAPPVVTSIVAVGGDNSLFEVEWDRPITLQEWTTIGFVNACSAAGLPLETLGNLGPGVAEPDRVDVGFLPTDVDQNSSITPFDLLEFRVLVNGGSTETLLLDMDRNDLIQPFDLLRFRLQINGGAPATQSWNGTAMNNPQP